MLAERIETGRLTLRQWVFEDVGDVFSYAQDAEWSRYLPLPQPYSEDDARRFVARQVLLDRRQHLSWAIEFDGSVIGGCNLQFLCDHRVGEIGYSISRSHWGRGLGTEAARALVGCAFQCCSDLMRLRAAADARNKASVRVLEKVPMRQEGILRSNRFVHDVPVDEVWFGLLRSDWPSG
jgi:RimJ/RimL family protein N-acetyltransferase